MSLNHISDLFDEESTGAIQAVGKPFLISRSTAYER
ncbi:hypothetical protein ADUPG1_000382, partial [Aduncisulcus paluster]